MKDSVVLIEPEDIHAFTRKLWRTDLFRKSHDEGGLVYKAVEQFARVPKFFFRVSHEAENPHFSAWWGGIQMREYDSEAIHDLYYLHEIWHAGTMPYMQDMRFENFQRKMIDNELGASVLSEMVIYCEMPELRKMTFPYETFIDRILFPSGYGSPPDTQVLEDWKERPDVLVEEFKLKRRNVMMAQNPNIDDDVEFWIQKFTHQNQMWAHLWYARYKMVETAMVGLIHDCKFMGREKAMGKFMSWLTSEEVTKGTDIPFPDEAHAFLGVYALNKGLYKSTFEKIRNSQPVTYHAAGGTPPAIAPS